MKKHDSLRWAILAITLGFGVAGNVQAASTWVFTDSGANTIADANNPAHDIATTSYTQPETTLNISGAYTPDMSSNWNTTASNTGRSATLVIYGGGLGMNSDGSGEPNHAIDNNNNTEAVLLSFGNSVILTGVGLGYRNTDSDISLFRYAGTNTPPLNLNTVGAGLASMASAGWDLVSNYANLGVNTSSFNAVNSSNLSSSWWLVSAYNPGYSAPGHTWSSGNDYMKIFGVASQCTYTNTNGTCGNGNTPATSVPEPGSLALVALGLLGVAGLRRRQNAKAA